MYVCVLRYRASFYDFSIEFLKYFDSVAYFVFRTIFSRSWIIDGYDYFHD